PAAKTIESCVARRPAEQLQRLRVVSAEPLDFALLRAHALGLGLDIDVNSHQIRDHLDSIAHGDLVVAAEVDDLTDTAVTSEGGDKPADGVTDVVEIAPRVQRAEL